MVGSCNAPDTTFHIRNFNSCLFRRCVMLFPPWLGFVFCFVVCSCLAFHIIASSALHPHVFIKPRSHSYVTASLFVFVDLLSDRLSLLTFSQTNWTPLFSLSPRPTKPPLSPWPFVRPHCLCFPLSSKCPPSLHSHQPLCTRPKLPRTQTSLSLPLDSVHPQTSIKHLRFLIWTL